jgi:hypothetical protein
MAVRAAGDDRSPVRPKAVTVTAWPVVDAVTVTARVGAMSDELPTQRILGVEYRSCEWCGAAVSQVGTRTPRLYCKRSHRQRAFDARKHGEPMLKDRPARDGSARRPAVPAPAAPAEQLLVPSVPEVVPDPPAALPVVVPLPPLKRGRRRSTMTASAIPLLPAEDEPRRWLRAFDVEPGQGSLFDGQEDELGSAPGAAHGE